MDRTHRLSISRQARLLGISRGSVDSQRRPPSAVDLALMRRMDELQLAYPFAGSQAIERYLEDFDDLAIALERLREPADPVLDWNQVKRELLHSD